MLFVRVLAQDGGFLGGGVGPEEFDASLVIVSEEAFGVEGAAVDVSSESHRRHAGGLDRSEGL